MISRARATLSGLGSLGIGHAVERRKQTPGTLRTPRVSVIEDRWLFGVVIPTRHGVRGGRPRRLDACVRDHEDATREGPPSGQRSPRLRVLP